MAGYSLDQAHFAYRTVPVVWGCWRDGLIDAAKVWTTPHNITSHNDTDTPNPQLYQHTHPDPPVATGDPPGEPSRPDKASPAA